MAVTFVASISSSVMSQRAGDDRVLAELVLRGAAHAGAQDQQLAVAWRQRVLGQHVRWRTPASDAAAPGGGPACRRCSAARRPARAAHPRSYSSVDAPATGRRRERGGAVVRARAVSGAVIGDHPVPAGRLGAMATSECTFCSRDRRDVARSRRVRRRRRRRLPRPVAGVQGPRAGRAAPARGHARRSAVGARRRRTSSGCSGSAPRCPAALDCDGTFVAINNVVSQSVAHLHTHVVPRRRKDGLRGFFWPRTKYADDADAERFARRSLRARRSR